MKNLTVLLFIVIVISGCALMEMKNENEALRNRIVLKEKHLNELEKQHHLLYKKEQSLANNLETAGLNLDQINDDLDDLITGNERLAQLKHERQKSVKEIEQAIENMRSSQHRISELEQQDISVAEKERKIQALREEIRQYLTIGLKTKYRHDQ